MQKKLSRTEFCRDKLSVATNKVMSRQNFELFLQHWFFLSRQKNQTSAQVARNSVATQFLSVATKLVLAFDLQ